MKKSIEEVQEYAVERQKLLGSLLLFTKTFFKLRTGKQFTLSHPIARESHFISICRALTKVFHGETERLIINVPPRYGKTELLIHFVAWAIARYPDSNFLYISFSRTLASKATSAIRDIINLPQFQELFLVDIKKSSKAKSDFEFTEGGSVYAAGTAGTITGYGAGIKNCNRFGGAIVIDDAHKPDEVYSDITRDRVIDRYNNTIKSRRNNGEKTPIIAIGQCLHEADMMYHLREKDTEKWEVVKLAGLDGAQNALYPELHSKEFLLDWQATEPYVFAAQIQQNPQPAGGGIFKQEWFLTLNYKPEILMTFITVDTAETEKSYNDATVFSFWGLYRIKQTGIETDVYALHWIDCWELRVEPKDLKFNFIQFYHQCLMYDVKPSLAAIEQKSTGTTLFSVMEDIQGLHVITIKQSKAIGSKTARFLKTQPYVAKKHITLPAGAKHTEMCIKHCAKITANQSHRFDDIADTLESAVRIGLIDQTVISIYIKPRQSQQNNVINSLLQTHQQTQSLREKRQWI